MAWTYTSMFLNKGSSAPPEKKKGRNPIKKSPTEKVRTASPSSPSSSERTTKTIGTTTIKSTSVPVQSKSPLVIKDIGGPQTSRNFSVKTSPTVNNASFSGPKPPAPVKYVPVSLPRSTSKKASEGKTPRPNSKSIPNGKSILNKNELTTSKTVTAHAKEITITNNTTSESNQKPTPTNTNIPIKQTTTSKNNIPEDIKQKGRPLKRGRPSKKDNLSKDESQPQNASKQSAIKDKNSKFVRQTSVDQTRINNTRKDSTNTSNAKSSGSKRHAPESNYPGSKKAAKNVDPPRRGLPVLDDTYMLKHVIKGHTEINIPVRDKDDIEDSKDIWCCEFEPTAGDLGVYDRQKAGQTQNVALCGSYTVLFADTLQGKYIKKYTHVENQEIFYCMAWTRLEGHQLLNADVFDDEDDVAFCNILAVAGRLGSVKLLSPLQNECYRYLFGHKKAILAMAFAKTEPRWLFTASADKTIRLWDIGSPTSKMDDSICLAQFNLSSKSGEPSAVSISYDLSTLIVGCSNGDLIEFTITANQLKQFRTKAEEYRSNRDKRDKWELMTNIDRSTKYPAGDEWHEGYVDDVYVIGQDGDERNKLNNKIVSRGSEDMEIIIWDPVESTRTDAKIEMSLDWPDAADCTGLRFKLIEKEGEKVLIAGEYDGQICIYNIGNGQKSKTLSDGSKAQFKPNRILSHSMSTEMIRDVTCSYDTRTIISVDNNNNMFIWTSSTI
ncbi:hypothetical protein INT46_008926 [Mucor plumbeus]|uniref:Leucine-rich repeat and WD repeat-containing protein 1 WD domain-containing protein n=1 Tax=Mucor plumbeus TaxID=97098 RepID=A0A8H7QGK0_9FUNG|nr:hypothetical protein INT46_008926 [Mucor plumbeus]